MSHDDVTHLRDLAESVDVASRRHAALFWSGKDVPTIEPLHEGHADGPRWLDKYALQEATVLRALGLAMTVEDTPGGRYYLSLGLDYAEDHPLCRVARELWDVLSKRFAAAAHGRVEVLAEGTTADSVFRSVEFHALLANPRVVCINGLDKAVLPVDAQDAFSLLRRWDVERSRRYSTWVDARPDASPREKEAARDDYREAQLWFEQDFFERLGPRRELPPLPRCAQSAVDRTCAARAWKYAPPWRASRRA